MLGVGAHQALLGTQPTAGQGLWLALTQALSQRERGQAVPASGASRLQSDPGCPPAQRHARASVKGMPSGSEGSSPKGVRATRPAAPERTEASAARLQRKFFKI